MAEAGVFPERLRWLPHFIDTSSIERKRERGGPVVFAGRLSPEKGVDTLIEAVGRLGCRLEIAGDGPQRARPDELAETVAPGQVRLHGRVGGGDVHRPLRAAAAAAGPPP